jgi:S-adenosylmethionine:tRNA ribosyltransferase-isomerase
MRGRRSLAAFARPARKLKQGDVIAFDGGLSTTVAEKGEGGEVELAFDRGGAELMVALAAVGRMPLPPIYQAARRRRRT